MNRDLMEWVKCMLLEGSVPNGIWGEAFNTTSYLANRCPLAALNFKTLEERWIGHRPSCDDVKVFGYVAYTHVKNEEHDDERINMCMFIGCLGMLPIHM